MALYAAIVLYASLLPISLFVVYYLVRSNWSVTPVGRIIMGLLLSFLAVMLIGLVSYTFDPVWLDIVRAVVYGLMHIGLWRLFISLRKVQRTNEDGSLERTDVGKLWSLVTRSKKNDRL